MKINIFNKSTSRILLIFLAYCTCLALWEGLVTIKLIPEIMLPPPSKILIALINILEDIQDHVVYTIFSSFSGLCISILIAFVLVFLMDSFVLIKEFMLPIVILSQAIPIIVFIPLLVWWFGFGITPKILIVVLVCVFPLIISLFNGVNSADKETIHLLKIMGANKFQIIRHVKLPSALTEFFSGLQIAATYSVIGAIIGEWMGGGNLGLGIYMLKVKNYFEIDKVFAVILIVILITIMYWAAILILQKVLIPWNQKN